MSQIKETTQEYALKRLRTGKNIFLTGPAGTGKTYVLNQYIKEAQEQGKTVLISAPTGIAALNLNGVTMHQAFSIPVPAYGHYDFELTPSKYKLAAQADIIIIDEISMCRNDVFEYFAMIIKTIKKELKKNIQIIVSGDFYQLPPVVKQDEVKTLKKFGLHESGYCFTTKAWQDFKFEGIELTKIMRQDDDDFLKNLGLLRKGDAGCIKYFNEHVTPPDESKDYVYICSTNASAELINDKMLAEISGPSFVYKATKEGFCAKDYSVDEALVLKPGCKVMFMANDVVDNSYSNGAIGEIVRCEEKYVIVKLNDKEIPVGTYDWKNYKYSFSNGITAKSEIGKFSQLPLKLAYAITMHKTQGQTYKNAVVTPSSFADGQLYVALSRVRDINGLYLTDPISAKDIKVSSLVKKFYETFSYDVPESNIEKRKNLEKKAKAKNKAKKTKTKKTTKKSTSAKKTTTKKTNSKVATKASVNSDTSASAKASKTAKIAKVTKLTVKPKTKPKTKKDVKNTTATKATTKTTKSVKGTAIKKTTTKKTVKSAVKSQAKQEAKTTGTNKKVNSTTKASSKKSTSIKNIANKKITTDKKVYKDASQEKVK